MDKRYTLDDNLFKYSLAKGSDSEAVFDDGSKIMVVGGVATQLTSSDKNFLRPTTDIDFILDRATSRSDRKKWAQYLGQKVEQDGHSVNYGLSRYGAEVNFINLERSLLIHFDCFGNGFFNKQGKRIMGEYERAETYNVLDTPVRCQSPMDIIINKLRRIKLLKNFGDIDLNSYEKYFFGLIEDAQFDDIDTDKLNNMLEDSIRKRNQTIEDLSREGFKSVKQQINQYKVGKDIYDISLVIDACRKKNIKIPTKTFKKNLKLAL